jgi:hypothetical protein
VIALDHLALSRGSSNVIRGITLINSVHDTTDVVDWRTHLITYIRNPSVKKDRGTQWMAFKYVLLDDELYCELLTIFSLSV